MSIHKFIHCFLKHFLCVSDFINISSVSHQSLDVMYPFVHPPNLPLREAKFDLCVIRLSSFSGESDSIAQIPLISL